MRTLDRFDSSAGERGKRLLRSAETAVHQFVLAQHHGEIAAPSHQAKLNLCARHACRIDLQPWNHAMLLRCFGWIARGPSLLNPRILRARPICRKHIRINDNEVLCSWWTWVFLRRFLREFRISPKYQY